MLVRLQSDIHLEFGYYEPPEMLDDRDSVLILAGDIGLADKAWTLNSFIEGMSERFKEVIYILGNHEYYRTSFLRGFDKLCELFSGYDNVKIINNQTIIINDVAFVCSTLWTDFNKGNPITMYTAKQIMNDYRLIRTGTSNDPYKRKLQPMDTYIAHQKATEYIFPEITEQKKKGKKVVVVTHHAPSYQSVAPQYRGNGEGLNNCYVSDLSEQILDTQPDIWVHGHTHASFDYNIGNTRVIANPRGYPEEHGGENKDYDPYFRFEI